MRALDLAIQNEGLRICILLRLCPLVPFNAFNYLMGGTSISFKNYVLGGFATIPIVTINIFMGTTIGSIKAAVSGEYEGGIVEVVILSVGALLSVFLVVYIGALIKRYLKRFAQKTTIEQQELAVLPAEQAKKGGTETNVRVVVQQNQIAPLAQ